MPLSARCLPSLVMLVSLAGCGPAPVPPQPAPARELPAVEQLSVSALRSGLAEGTFTSEAIVEAYLARIAAYDDAGPRLDAVIALAPDAMAQAKALDVERRAGQLRGPLHGLPVLLKDNIDAVGMPTSAGSLALAQHFPGRDAHLVERLRAAGLVILGKTNLSEWANFRSNRSTSGWSSLGGQTRNPHVLDRSPCGSSSGSGVAAAMGFAAFTVGTETDGSIICPAAVNGVVGIKPTLGLVSRHGIVPISPAQDTAGPMARSVADAAALLGAMVGSDARDAATADADARRARDYTVFLDADALRGARIGVLRQAMGFHPAVDATMEASIERLRAAGAEIIDPVEIPSWRQWGADEFKSLLAEFAPALRDYLVDSGAPFADLAALAAFNREHAAQVMPWFGQELFEQALASPSPDDPAIAQARADARRLAGEQGIDAALAAHRLDALLTTAVAPAWALDPVNGDHFLGSGYSIAAVAGYPSVTVPAGDAHGLPIGVVFVGAAWSEARLIGYAHAFERQRGERPLLPALRASIAP